MASSGISWLQFPWRWGRKSFPRGTQACVMAENHNSEQKSFVKLCFPSPGASFDGGLQDHGSQHFVNLDSHYSESPRG